MKPRIASFSSAAVIALAAAFSAVLPNVPAAASTAAQPAASAGSQDLAGLATRLEQRLGARSAGSYIDQTTGKLVVTVTDVSAAQAVRAAGAVPRTVARNQADLERATEVLDRSARIPGTAWAIDPATDQVVVSVDQSVKGTNLAKLESVARKLGAAVRIERLNGRLGRFAGPTMLDGTAIYAGTALGTERCSLGYNVFDNFGRHYFITAGHCTQDGTDWYANQGLSSRLGHNTGLSVFGPGGDWGLVEYDTAGIHVYGTVAGSGKFITSAGDAVVGLSIRRSGSTTGVRGGHVKAVGATVTYSNGVTVNGLIKTDACAEPGDSGGPLYDGGSIALGMLSGGSGNCSSGGTTFYQPVASILQTYALTLWDVPQP